MAISDSESTKATACESLDYEYSNKAVDIQIASVKAQPFLCREFHVPPMLSHAGRHGEIARS